jgi:hypothetical protein
MPDKVYKNVNTSNIISADRLKVKQLIVYLSMLSECSYLGIIHHLLILNPNLMRL